MKSARYRARLAPRDLAKFFREQSLIDPRPINAIAHQAQHGPSTIVYTSKTSLSTDAGTPLYPQRGGALGHIRMNLTGTGATNTVLDILFDGVSIFPSSTKPKVTAGSLVGRYAIADRISFQPDTKIQCQLTATGGATGPMVVTLEYDPDFF